MEVLTMNNEHSIGGMRMPPSGVDPAEMIAKPNYTEMLKFEREFNKFESQGWMEANWTTSFYWVGAYLLFIFLGQQYMENRPRFELKKTLILWNGLLAAFSIFGSYRMVPEMLWILNRPNGFHHSVCHPSWSQNQVWQVWTYLFITSKALELGDTVFIVLRKQPLIFLHWYHHVTVLLYSWYSYGEFIAPARWFVTTNFVIHSFMYSYYALRALRVRIPKPIAVTITSLQIVQMVVGVTVNVHAYFAKQKGESCDVSDRNISLSLIMYASYFILFARFFYKAYLSKPSGGKPRDARKTE